MAPVWETSKGSRVCLVLKKVREGKEAWELGEAKGRLGSTLKLVCPGIST